MNLDIQKMKEKVLLIADPNSKYTQEDFNKEFGGFEVNKNSGFKFDFKFVNKSNNEDPTYATDGASGFDLRAFIEEPMIILPHDRAIVPTGLYFEILPNFEIQIRPRSGLAAKNGVTVLNAPGTIDADYRGEIKVILINHSNDNFIINNGDRIAQAVIATVVAKNVVNLTNVNELNNNTERGNNGFGSTGHK